jgi:multidrug efflux pump subunit AcrA (membrane-fusion protein)
MNRARTIVNQLKSFSVAQRSEGGSNRDVIRAPLRDLYLQSALDALAQARAGRTRLQMEIVRLERLGQELEDGQTRAHAAWKTGQEALARYARVTAPMRGTISECQVHSDERVSAGDELLKIIQTDRVQVLVWVPPARLTDGEQSFAARIRQPGMGNRWVTAESVRISSLPHPRTGQYLVEFELNNGDNRFEPGCIVDARLTQSIESDTR